MKPHKWSYRREDSSNSGRQQTGTFKITSAIERPRDVFVWILNDARKASQAQNPFLFDTFNMVNNRTLESCQLEVGNGNNYFTNPIRPGLFWSSLSLGGGASKAPPPFLHKSESIDAIDMKLGG